VVLSTRATLARQGVHGLRHFLLDCSWLFPMEVSMSKKLLAQALEFLEDSQHLVADNERHAYVMEYNSFIEQLKEALAKQEQGEPVAVKHMMEWADYLKRKSDYGQHMKIPSGMSAGACWELAVELEQFINTTPQQRTWVGLTTKDQKEIQRQSVYVEGAIRMTEAKLKEKNI
jgi:hypothetical protein